MTSSMQWSTYSHHSINQQINLPHVSVSTSKSASMTQFELISFLSKSTSESASITRSIVSLLQEQIMIDLVDRASHSIVSLLQRHCQCNDLFTHIALFISESNYYVHMQLVSLLQWHFSSRQWFTSTLLYQSANRFISSFCSTSESASMIILSLS